MRWKLRGKEGTRSLENVMILAFTDTIFSKSILISKKTLMCIRMYSDGISSESVDGRIKLGANYSGKLLVDRQKLPTR